MMRPCLDCGALFDAGASGQARCDLHRRARERGRNQRRVQYQGSWQTQRRQILRTYRATVGDWCPGLTLQDVAGRADLVTAAHGSSDLTVDHRHDGTLSVLCRSCNGRKGAVRPVFGDCV